MIKTGKITVKSKEPVTALAAYFEVTDASRVEVTKAIKKNRTVLYRAIWGESCSGAVAKLLEEVTGLPAGAIVYCEKRKKWTMELLENGKVKLCNWSAG